jgi:hypothetical protein
MALHISFWNGQANRKKHDWGELKTFYSVLIQRQANREKLLKILPPKIRNN